MITLLSKTNQDGHACRVLNVQSWIDDENKEEKHITVCKMNTGQWEIKKYINSNIVFSIQDICYGNGVLIKFFYLYWPVVLFTALLFLFNRRDHSHAVTC